MKANLNDLENDSLCNKISDTEDEFCSAATTGVPNKNLAHLIPFEISKSDPPF